MTDKQKKLLDEIILETELGFQGIDEYAETLEDTYVCTYHFDNIKELVEEILVEELIMTKEALDKLNEKQMNYCKTMSALIARARENSLKEEFKRNSGKLRGFLECLCQMNIISGIELKALYLYFFAEDRNK